MTDWEIYFKNPASQFDQFVDEEKTIVQAGTEKDARAAMRSLLGRFGYITEIQRLTAPEPVVAAVTVRVETKEK